MKALLLNTTRVCFGPQTDAGQANPELTSAIGAINELILSGDVKLADYRAMFHGIHKRETTLNNEQLIAMIAGSEDDKAPADWAATMLALEGDTASGVDVSAQTQGTKATSMAVLAGGDEQLTNDVESYIAGKEATQMGPLWVYEDFVRIFAADMASFPIPGSTIDGKNKSVKSNNPDKYTVSVKDTEKGGMKDIPGSWYKDFALSLPRGVEIQANIDGAKKRHKALEINDEQVAKAVAKFEAQRNSLVSVVTRAGGLHHQIEAIKAMPSVRFAIEKDTVLVDGVETEVTSTTARPFLLGDARKLSDFNLLSVGQFLSLDVAKAVQNGGTKKALLDTVKRSGNAPEGDEEEAMPTMEDVGDKLAMVLHFFEDVASDKKKQGALYKKLNAEGSDDLLMTVFGLAFELDKVTSKPDLAARYAKLEAAGKSAPAEAPAPAAIASK